MKENSKEKKNLCEYSYAFVCFHFVPKWKIKHTQQSHKVALLDQVEWKFWVYSSPINYDYPLISLGTKRGILMDLWGKGIGVEPRRQRDRKGDDEGGAKGIVRHNSCHMQWGTRKQVSLPFMVVPFCFSFSAFWFLLAHDELYIYSEFGFLLFP